MKIPTSDIPMRIPFEKSINGVRDAEAEEYILPIRRKLTPINGGTSESKLSELFHPISMRELHLQKILSPPRIDSVVTTPDAFRRLLARTTIRLKKFNSNESIVVCSALDVLERIEKNRELLDSELIKLVEA